MTFVEAILHNMPQISKPRTVVPDLAVTGL